MNTVSLKKGFSTFDLKILGITLMFIDHIHQMFYPFGAPDWLDWFGRPVATLFFFISVAGFSHTHDKKKYMQRLYFSMVLMAFFTYFLGNIVHYDEVVLINNIFRDLFIGTVMMYAIDLFTDGKNTGSWKKILTSIFLFILPILLSLFIPLLFSSPVIVQNKIVFMLITSFLPALLLAENNFMVLLIPLLYLARNHRSIQCIIISIVAGIYFFLGTTQWILIFSVIPILLYNGQKGKGMKYFFYIFYPAHIALLYLLSAFLYKY
ncbi:hypothetical protein HQ932_11820 [Enterococcus faecium]|uniref:TraX family protein n=1 Tax=Enterococcus faecium TaxID=1352 RepID=UPI001DB228A1|nr:hypothetical protein [Enterococcus faecium]NTR50438.1 hypothetical protein [Enterococcus faecium]NTR52883.1 hypothetical protein [Enterococcus faecium]NTS01633.1 hypothetical protein [Enterococcus faecium]